MLGAQQDAYGHQLYDYFKGKNQGLEVVERDDGFIQATLGPRTYLSQYQDWASHEKEAIRHARGRVLDVGCGGGRHSLYLQKKGLRVVGIDQSPLAIRVCKLRGLKNAHEMSIDHLQPGFGSFDTVLMFGNGFGLFHSPLRAKITLRNLFKFTNPRARIIAESLDPHKTTEPSHLQYQKRNKRLRRLAGQIRIRIRYKKYSTPWFDYLLVSKTEMKQIVKGTGWRVTRFLSARGQRVSTRGAVYAATIQRD